MVLSQFHLGTVVQTMDNFIWWQVTIEQFQSVQRPFLHTCNCEYAHSKRTHLTKAMYESLVQHLKSSAFYTQDSDLSIRAWCFAFFILQQPTFLLVT